jgi:hypothetical protein
MIGRILSKAQNTTLSTRHLVPRLHCNLVACQQLAHATYCIHTIGER